MVCLRSRGPPGDLRRPREGPRIAQGDHPGVEVFYCHQLTAKTKDPPYANSHFLKTGFCPSFCRERAGSIAQLLGVGTRVRSRKASPASGVGSCRLRWPPHFSVGGPPFTGIVNIILKLRVDGAVQTPQTPNPHGRTQLIRISFFPGPQKHKDPKGSRVACACGVSGGLGIRVIKSESPSP